MKAFVLATSLSAALACASFAQDAAKDAKDKSPEKDAITAVDRAFEAAYAKADVKTLLDFFTEDAEYTSDEGRTFTGRAEIEGALRAAFLANKGAKLAISLDTVRSLTPDVLIEKGSTKVTEKDGDENGALYTAVYAKKDGKWKISQLVETPMPDLTPRDHLAQLDWLVGEWEESDKGSDLSVNSQYVWARGGNFITRNVTVKRAGNTTMEGWQVIGWDPIQGHIRSWTFDSEGGFSDGVWTRDGDRWLLRETGVSADGSRTSADNTFNKVGADKFTWESNNRTLDGEPQPGIGRLEINRVKGN